ncbi:MAG: class I SAM-dependent methyltransferase [Gammaproteobacteria bacterium]|nr:class I SAM-dependent methyltransferase [Gammaproteobacteria bacterium]
MTDLDNLSLVYDKFAESYDDKRELFNIDHIISDFRNRLETPGALLDIGCGAGIPVGRSFVDNNWVVTGIDFSAKMLALANTHVPEMKTICSDMRDIQFDDGDFDAISMIYSLFHIPKEQQSDLFARLFRWLKPNGMALFTYATKEYTGSEQFNGNKEFLGQQLFYSHDTPENLFQTLEEIGFVIEARDYHCVADETFLWVTMRKPAL